MMRAFAVLTTGAIALIALPVTAGATAETVDNAAPVADRASGVEGFLARPALLGLSTGAALWLSMALVALVVAVAAVRRSKSLSASLAPAAADQLISDWSEEQHRVQNMPVQRTPLRSESVDHSGVVTPAAR